MVYLSLAMTEFACELTEKPYMDLLLNARLCNVSDKAMKSLCTHLE